MISESTLEYIFHHVFLPPKLPHEEDSRTKHDSALTQLFREELQRFHDGLPCPLKPQFKRMIQMVKNLASDENDTTGPASKVIGSLEKMEAEDVYAIHVEQQNAGIIIRRFTTEYSFETFELSPKNEDATTTTGRLRRYFPGPAVAVPHSRINEGAFQEVLHQCIEELVRETPIIVQPRSVKANAVDIEIRDTVDPALVTSMLTEFLHAAGRRHDVNRIQKRTREVIQWYNCLEPWRRSPRWLLLRVCLQTGLVEEKK